VPDRRRIVRFAVRRLLAIGVGLALVAVAVIVMGMLGIAESVFVYHPSRDGFTTPIGVEDVAITTRDGLTLHAWWMPPIGVEDGARAPAVLHVHGNAGNISHHEAYSSFLPREGIGVLIFDYRSYGRSERSPRRINRSDLVVDTDAALDLLLARPDVDPARVGIYGVSLGAVIGLAVAAERPEVTAVVELSGFASWKGIGRSHAGPIGGWLFRSGYDAVDSVARLDDRPLLIVHGDLDDVVPVSHAHEIGEAAIGAGVGVESHISAGTGHNDLLWEDTEAQIRIVSFLRRELGRDAPGPE
jgi:dipeptidyl aminopeptidase/acylaminoacyl peptidase